jgi:hypothetical protein
MSQSELGPTPVTFNVTIADASNLPIHHVNALALRTGVDEFFFTLGVVVPPDQVEAAAAAEAGYLEAQPVFRFAISRDTMEKFLAVMAGQYDQQTTLIKQLHHLGEETSKEEGSENE